MREYMEPRVDGEAKVEPSDGIWRDIHTLVLFLFCFLQWIFHKTVIYSYSDVSEVIILKSVTYVDMNGSLERCQMKSTVV